MSTSGLFGAGIGLVIALVEYVTILAMFERRAAARMAETPARDRPAIEQTLKTFRLVFRANFVMLPVLGYVLGQVLFP